MASGLLSVARILAFRCGEKRRNSVPAIRLVCSASGSRAITKACYRPRGELPEPVSSIISRVDHLRRRSDGHVYAVHGVNVNKEDFNAHWSLSLADAQETRKWLTRNALPDDRPTNSCVEPGGKRFRILRTPLCARLALGFLNVVRNGRSKARLRHARNDKAGYFCTSTADQYDQS